jgi:hypothetical protein
VLTCGVAVLTVPALHAQTPTTTSSTTSVTVFESPPKCEVIGSSRQQVSVTQQAQTGPACIGIGNRDVVNPSPSCGGLPPGQPEPNHGSTFLVQSGTQNTNTNTLTQTLECVPPTPALPLPWLTGLGAGVIGAGAALLRRLRPAAPTGTASA